MQLRKKTEQLSKIVCAGSGGREGKKGERVVRVELREKVTFKQRLKGSEGVSHEDKEGQEHSR